jgi:GntR family transcriptional regulator / MocR family aminotransferase
MASRIARPLRGTPSRSARALGSIFALSKRAMSTWDMTVQISAEATAPLFRKIGAAIVADVERGRLRPGEQLPSSRALSKQLGVHRNTVLTAYNDLRARGWIMGSPARGMFVADRRALAPTSPPPVPLAPFAYDLPAPPVPLVPDRRPDLPYVLLGGVADLRFLPLKQLARAYRDALRGASSQRLLGYGDPRGDERLRAALADLLARLRGMRARPEAICVVRGGQQGLYLAARALLSPGDKVAVEEYGFPGGHHALRLAGAELLPVPLDRDGLDVDALERLARDEGVRAIYLTPHHQCPTTVTLSPERRARLMKLAERHRMLVIEDDYDFDFHYDGPPRLPLAATDAGGRVVYVGTLSKTLAPGIRLGYVSASPEITRRISSVRHYVDGQGDHALERAIALLLEDGVVQRHTRRALAAYRTRRAAMCSALRRHLPRLAFSVPAGGTAVWARAPGVDVDAWVGRARSLGVAFQAGTMFRCDGRPDDGARIGFAACDEREIDEAVRRMALAFGGESWAREPRAATANGQPTPP